MCNDRGVNATVPISNHCKSDDFSVKSRPMKKTLLLCILVALCFGGAARAWAAADPGDRFLEAYFLIQEGDAAVRDSDWTKANTKYGGALDILNEIKTDSPDWNPHIIEFRTKYINDHLSEVKAKLTLSSGTSPQPQPLPPTPETPETPAATAPATQPQPEPPAVSTTETNPAPAVPIAPAVPAEPAVSTITTNPAMAAESEQVRQLTSELQRAHEQVEQLETARNELNAKLQEQLSKVAPTQTTPQIEELLKTNQDLAAKLAAAQTQIEEAREHAGAAAPAAPAPTADVEQLRTELAQARGELQQTKEELQQTRLELGTTKQALEKSQTENADLRRSYEEVIGQLTDANKKLTAAKAGSDKDDEIIRQLRKENALLRIIAERKASDSITTGEGEDNVNGPSIPELRGWRPHPRPVAKPKPEATKPQPTTEPSSMEESTRGKLVATLSAPRKAEPTNEIVVAEPPKPQTNAPAKPPAPVKPPVPVKPPPPVNPPAPVKTTPPPEPKKETAPPVVVAPKEKVPVVAASPDVRQLLNEGRAALALKDYNTAGTKYEAALGLDPTNTVALANLGVIRYQQNRLDDAEQYLRQAAAAAPNDSNTRSLLGVVYFRKGAIEDAYSELNRAVAIDPHNAEAHNYLGIVLSEKGWGASGELEIRRAIEINPQYADAHFNLAVVYAKERNPKVELARYHYKKALDLGAPPDPELEALLKKLSAKPAAPADEEIK
jgi:tetratricopeptide (TPR) repeat protein